MVTATSVTNVMKMGNTTPREGIEPTSPTFLPSVLTITPPIFPDVTILHTPVCLCGSLPLRGRGQCRLQQYSKTSLNRSTMGPTLSCPFRELVGLGIEYIIMGDRLGPK